MSAKGFVFPLRGDRCQLRPWSLEDLPSLVHHANNAAIAAQLRDVFPHPYSAADGRAFIEGIGRNAPPTALAIVVDGAACGGTGVMPQHGNERRTAEIGYWLGETYWGRGIAPEALALATRYAVDTFDVVRLEAFVITSHTRSCRVLEKAGYVNEGCRRQSFLKHGVLHDQYCFSWIRP